MSNKNKNNGFTFENIINVGQYLKFVGKKTDLVFIKAVRKTLMYQNSLYPLFFSHHTLFNNSIFKEYFYNILYKESNMAICVIFNDNTFLFLVYYEKFCMDLFHH